MYVDSDDDDDNEEKEKRVGHRACIYKVTHLIRLLMNQKIRKEHFAWCTSVNLWCKNQSSVLEVNERLVEKKKK
jgi:hypothetical protein